jgi:periplasmic protein TonB
MMEKSDRKRILEDKKLEKRTSIKALSSTIILFALLLILLINLGLTIKLPLPGGTEGIEVMLGDGDFGQDNFGEAIEQTIQLEQKIIPKQEIKVNETNPTTETNNQVLTQNIEEAPAITTTEEQKKEVKKEEKKSNPLFEYNKSSKGKTSVGSNNNPGNQGNPNGTPTGSKTGNGGKGTQGTGPGYSGTNGPGDYGDGTQFQASSGFSFNLKGRKLVDRPIINDDDQFEGRIVVEITVNRQGKVVKAIVTRGSTATAGTMVERALNAALKVSFSTDQEAPEEQFGTITFNFKLK